MEVKTIFDSDRAEYEYAKQIEKQSIEEMAKVIEKTEQIARDAHCGLPSPTMYAKDLYWKGYRKQSEEGAECPTCHGTGRIGTTDWLTKNISKKQLAEEKAKAIAEHEQYIKTEYAREIFEEICASIAIHAFTSRSEDYANGAYDTIEWVDSKIAELKKKYTEEET